MAKAARMSVWLEESRPGRGRRSEQPSGLDRERITSATVKLLDAEGLAKFSMRRLAGELGVTAMSVYWYVDTKDDLLELALDRAFGEPKVSGMGVEDPDDADWSEQVRRLATEYRALLVRHPWISPLVGNYLNIGPNSLEFSAVVQRVFARTGLPMSAQRGAIASVMQFVYGYGTVEGHFRQRCADVGMTQDEYFRRTMTTFTAPADKPEMLRHAEETMAQVEAGGTVEQVRDLDFHVALDLQIAGIAALVAREGAR
ncbi:MULTISPECIES: TetR/AcrR family transcriptional regulator [unclassified Streptomyces]|uniref:TetR/AcrR family transcriptional regulator n=1 Tax=unclassified Streptomyces TaxID=2593676 RepID=UPI000DB90448|nr:MULTISPECIES: TetR/AcrR family transcriptional regulator [unclassified Streptomyces]MYT72968.1 TetR family transcriptional regulator [Streptomyces sp. SID8367]RAJ73762.1 TetR family transcriptional regulator [Streptomyces sp. PsTaAH-137]